jgi:quercetin dioxygenase-like cupin family protein
MAEPGTSDAEGGSSLEGWNVVAASDEDWFPWGDGGNARGRIVGSASGLTIFRVEAEAGYVGAVHDHRGAEGFVLLGGRVRNQGQELDAGDGWVASSGTRHDDFEALTDVVYLSIVTT